MSPFESKEASARREPSHDEGSSDEIEALGREPPEAHDVRPSREGRGNPASEGRPPARRGHRSNHENLKRANEELVAAKKQLQLAVAELKLVNGKLHERNLELSHANDDLTNLLSSTAIPLLMVGGDLGVRRFTIPAQKVLGLRPEAVGLPIDEVDFERFLPDPRGLVQAVIASGQPRKREVQDQDGHYYELRIHPYRTGEGKIDGAVILLVDIDQRKKAEQAWRAADRRKDEFLATLAHELRSPLAPIHNIVEAMRRARGDDELREKAHEVLYRQAQQLSRIVADVIEVSRVVEKKVELKPESVELSEVMETALESCRSMVEGRRHRLTVQLPPGRVTVNADPARLAQIVVHMINNAAKYTEPGGRIDVTAELTRAPVPPVEGSVGDHRVSKDHESEPRSDAKVLAAADTSEGAATHLVIRVRDTGIGIGEDLMPHIFEMFTQGQRSMAGGGLGVGLALARSLAQMHGGDLTAYSEGPGRGSEFVLSVPVGPRGTYEAPIEDVLDLKAPRKILVVDDNHDQAETLGELLRIMGHEVQLAYDGRAALDAVAGFAPDVALVDIGMPGLSGYEVARRIRQRSENHGMVLIAQTGWGQERDRKRSREAGFDHHLIKPIDITTLQRILSGEMHPSEAEA